MNHRTPAVVLPLAIPPFPAGLLRGLPFVGLLAAAGGLLLQSSPARAAAPIHLAADVATAPGPAGEPVLDPPTLRSLGVYWVVQEDGTHPASVDLAYRRTGQAAWTPGAPLLRCDTGPFKNEGGDPKRLNVALPAGARLFAGSALLLQPDTAYELRLTLHGAGPTTSRVLQAHTIAEPTQPAGMMVLHVRPGNGGGSGTEADPFLGLAAASKAARPGDLFLIHAGRYDGPVRLDRSGEPGRPIIWRGAGDGEVIVDAHRPLDHLEDHAIDARETHDVWFEQLSVCNAYSAICVHECIRVVVRRCHLFNVLSGVYGANNTNGQETALFISDNRMDGIMPWPATDQQWHDLPESRAVWVSGTGIEVCYNRISHFKDGMDLDDGPAVVADDFHNNDVHEMFDDGSEMDGSDRNTRNYYNRYTNVLCGVSFQPVYGGPVYAFRNVIYNIRNEPFKLHNSPSGAVIFHNTTLRSHEPLKLNTGDPITNCYSRNNLIVGTEGRAYDCTPEAFGCDFDYDGFVGWSGPVFLKWKNVRYATPAEVRANCPAERHVVTPAAAGLFASGLQAPQNELTVFPADSIDVRLQPGSGAVDAGEILPGFNDGFTGARPDLGAIELGTAPPHYGPRS